MRQRAGNPKPSPEDASRNERAPLVLCAGIAVLDFIFRVDRFPTPAAKSPTQEFLVTGGGCAANAAISIARLGGRARFCGPLGDDEMSDRIVRGLVGEEVDVRAIVRVSGAIASISGIFIDAAGERLLTTRREQGLGAARPFDPDALVNAADVILADNHFAEFVLPICAAAAKAGKPVVLDVDRATTPGDPLLACASHAIFSAEAMGLTTGHADHATALARAAQFCRNFVALTDGAAGVHWRDHNGRARHQPAYPIEAADTLAAGDVFHGAFALALAENRGVGDALRFASAAAALKCTRFGGIAGAPNRAAVEDLVRSAVQTSEPEKSG